MTLEINWRGNFDIPGLTSRYQQNNPQPPEHLYDWIPDLNRQNAKGDQSTTTEQTVANESTKALLPPPPSENNKVCGEAEFPVTELGNQPNTR